MEFNRASLGRQVAVLRLVILDEEEDEASKAQRTNAANAMNVASAQLRLVAAPAVRAAADELAKKHDEYEALRKPATATRNKFHDELRDLRQRFVKAARTTLGVAD